MKRLAAIIALLVPAVVAFQADAATLTLKSGFVRYEATVKTLRVGAQPISAVNKTVIGKIIVKEDRSVEGGLIVPVVGFDSNNSKRDKDVARILEYQKYPAITFEVVDVKEADIEAILESDSGQVNMKAALSVAGRSKEYEITVSFRSVGSNMVRFATGIEARFSDFGIKPPNLAWVLKTTRDELYLSGELVFEVEKKLQTRE